MPTVSHKCVKLKFGMGQLACTPGVLSQISDADIATALARHLQGDWGELGPDDKKANDRAVVDGDRLLSAYHATESSGVWKGRTFWIITEWDRSVTTVLLPEEY